MGSRAVVRARGKGVAGRPNEVVDCGVGQARLQLADLAADPTAQSSSAGK